MQFKIKFFAMFLLINLNVFVNFAESKEKQTYKQKSTLESDALKEFIPIKQQIFYKNLEQFAIQYKSSPNAIQQFLLREKRKKFINENLKDRIFNEWIGRIIKLKTTENGEAYLEIELTKITLNNPGDITANSDFNITIGTMQKASTDLEHKTLLLPGSDLYNWLANFKEGEWVVFSGNGFLDKKDYLKMGSLTEYEAMLSPKFIAKFEFFEKINLLETNLNINVDNSLPNKKNVGGNSRQNNLTNTKTITIRYYQNYRLSNYNWNYHKFINRWLKLVRYHWNNHPPSDYLKGDLPKGGEVFVLAIVKRDGRVRKYKLNSSREVSKNMRMSALEAVKAVPLPSLPEDYPDEELKVEFRFELSKINHLIEGNSVKIKTTMQDDGEEKSYSDKSIFTKMEGKILKKQLITAARESYNEHIKHELSSHFNPVDRFDPNLELQIDISIDNSGRIIKKNLTSPVKSLKFQLAIMNSLSKTRFNSLPKSLVSNNPYRVRLKVIP